MMLWESTQNGTQQNKGNKFGLVLTDITWLPL